MPLKPYSTVQYSEIALSCMGCITWLKIWLILSLQLIIAIKEDEKREAAHPSLFARHQGDGNFFNVQYCCNTYGGIGRKFQDIEWGNNIEGVIFHYLLHSEK
jgi:hypothetical protein